MRRYLVIDFKKFIASMVISFIVIFGVIGFIMVDLSSINGVIQANSSSDRGVVEDVNQLSKLEQVANQFLSFRQKLWIADNPIIRVGRQVFYVVDLYIRSDGDFAKVYQEIDAKQSAHIKLRL